MVKERPFLKKYNPEAISMERQALKTLSKGPYITQLFCTFQSEDYLYFAMGYLGGGTLWRVLQVVQRPLDTVTLRILAAQMIIGLKYIHSKGIIHRDIKLENILLDGLGNIRIADFGLAAQNVFENDMIGGIAGTLTFIAPEMMGMGYNHSVDYFAMGITLFVMACFKHPFVENEETDDIPYFICCISPDYPSWMDLRLQDFLEKLLCKNPTMCQTLVKNLREDPFFNLIDWKDVETGKAWPPFCENLPQKEPRMNMPAFYITYSEARRFRRIKAKQQQLFKSFSFASEGW